MLGPYKNSEKRPFAEIDKVLSGSPAERAGFEVGDLLISFGPIFSATAWMKGKDGRQHLLIGSEIRCSKDRKVYVEVERGG